MDHLACSWEIGPYHTVLWFECETMSTGQKLTQLSPGGGAVTRGYQRLEQMQSRDQVT